MSDLDQQVAEAQGLKCVEARWGKGDRRTWSPFAAWVDKNGSRTYWVNGYYPSTDLNLAIEFAKMTGVLLQIRSSLHTLEDGVISYCVQANDTTYIHSNLAEAICRVTLKALEGKG